MALILRKTDKVKFAIDDIVVEFKPLTIHQKQAISTIKNELDMLIQMLKYTIKNVEGLQFADGEPLKLEFDNEGFLTNDSIEYLFDIDAGTQQKLQSISVQLLKGLSTEIKGSDGNLLEGVKYLGVVSKSSDAQGNLIPL